MNSLRDGLKKPGLLDLIIIVAIVLLLALLR
jgi:hypothetical protein